MKSLSKALIIFSLLGCFETTIAQKTPSPNLFDSYKTIISFPTTELEKIFSTSSGNSVQLALSYDAIFKGTIVSNIQRYQNLKSAVIKLTDFDGAMFSISERKNDDNSITYVGRIINENYSDAYVLKQETYGGYYLKKFKLNDLLQDR